MDDFFYFLEAHVNGVLVLILLLLVFILCLRWMAQIFGWGRFKSVSSTGKQDHSISYIITQIFVNIINDFKHFLALIIVLLFVTLSIFAVTSSDVYQEKIDALQLVIASLGGLLGSIIGYYYGESAARSTQSNVTPKGNPESIQKKGKPKPSKKNETAKDEEASTEGVDDVDIEIE